MKGRKTRSNGGLVPKEVYAGAGSNVVKEAEERKKGGPVKKDMPAVHGKKSMMRLDRPGRKSGGRVGADSSPLSSAANCENRSDTAQTDI